MEGDYGTIQNTDNGVNGYLTTNGNTAAGSAVVEDVFCDENECKWTRSMEVSGYFTLRNTGCVEKYLTGQSSGTPNSLTIEGNDDSSYT